jgi:hypothetical protein
MVETRVMDSGRVAEPRDLEDAEISGGEGEPDRTSGADSDLRT